MQYTVKFANNLHKELHHIEGCMVRWKSTQMYSFGKTIHNYQNHHVSSESKQLPNEV